METELDAASQRLELRFEDREEWRSFLERARADGGFLVPLEGPLRLHQRLQIRLSHSGRTEELVARVAQVFSGPPQPRVAFLLDELTTPDDETDASETLGTSPLHRIRQMNPNERARLAHRAARTERQILLRDRSALVLEALLANPQIDAEGVQILARSPHANAPLLQRIAQDSRWGKNQDIQSALARNPKTPAPVVMRLLPSLRTPDLKAMARLDSGFREHIRRAALAEYMKRTGQS